MLLREDVERISEIIIRELRLELTVEGNTRTISLQLNGRVIDEISFDIIHRSQDWDRM